MFASGVILERKRGDASVVGVNEPFDYYVVGINRH
jgi:hypothetical protein